MKIFFKTKQKSFSFFLLFSICVHAVVVIFFMGLNNFSLFFKKENITPISIRVDVVGLPDLPAKGKTVKIQKEKPVLLPDKRTKPKKPPSQKKLKEKKKDQSLEDSKQKKELKKVEQTKIQNEKKEDIDSEKTVNKGNQLTKGAEKGEEVLSSQEMAEINMYLTIVIEQIRANWNLPRYLKDMNLIAEVDIKINDRGEMVYKQIVLSSGNDVFDNWMLKAMENAAPYPPPPDSVQHLIRDGIVVSMSSKN